MNASTERPILRINIRNAEPVDLLDFTDSCTAFAEEFRRFGAATDGEEGLEPPRLLIKEVRSGSIEMDLVPAIYAAGAVVMSNPVAALSALNTTVSFFKNVSGIVRWLRGHAPAPETPPDSRTLENIERWIEPIAKDAGASLTLNVMHVTVNGDVNAPIILNSEDANVAQNVSRRKRKEMTTPRSGDLREQVLLRWHQSRNSVLGRGDMAIIESISPKPLRVVFQDKGMKSMLLAADENMFKRPYLVDVIIDSIEGVPKLYRIVGIEPMDDETA